MFLAYIMNWKSSQIQETVENWAKDFSEDDNQMANTYVKTFSTSLDIR